MIRLFGRAGGSRAVAGYVKKFISTADVMADAETGDAERGILLYEEAKNSVRNELDRLLEKAVSKAGVKSAQIFEARKMLLEDEGLDKSIRDLILVQHLSVNEAICRVCNGEAEKLENCGSELIAARAEDMREIRDMLTGTDALDITGSDLPAGTVLCADMLGASQILKLDTSKVAGIVCARGSELSHAAILAEDMGIASVWGCGEELLTSVEDGMRIALDSVSGEVFADIDEVSAAAFMKNKNGKDLLMTYKKAGVKLYANISRAGDANRLKGSEAAGVGLFRSEYLYIDRSYAPNEEEQFLEYKKAAEAVKPLPVTIRTADLGGDKLPAYMEDKGLRGLALSLSEAEMFKTQLRAIYRAAKYGNIKLMFPLVKDAEEFEKALAICREVRSELKSRAAVPIGVMIETKAAAEDSLKLGEIADFFSIGTNDLYSEALGMEKRDETVGDEGKVREQVLRLAGMSITNGHAGGTYVVICGRLAEDGEAAERFITLGADGVSLPAAMLA
ncbi:MAG: hypothetical protein K5686_11145 [Lachnospiraceae bacterium]|nr:hypothetical protein [Lachnospiraceae bacterium]